MATLKFLDVNENYKTIKNSDYNNLFNTTDNMIGEPVTKIQELKRKSIIKEYHYQLAKSKLKEQSSSIEKLLDLK